MTTSTTRRTITEVQFISATHAIYRLGLLRVGGRLHYAQIDLEAKHPFILPMRSPLTTLVIEDAHRRSLHGGT